MNSQAGAEHILLKNMRDILKECRSDNIQESYNDAVDVKDNALTAFKLGVISLEERASVEALYWNILNKIKELLNGLETVPEGLINLDGDLSSQYLCNFSVFQSTADCWAIDQLLPVVPITRLNEEPTVSATLADITCDSDGKIDKFIGNSGLNNTLKLHKLNGDDYYIGIFLTGAYQDVMGDNHNLFGRVSEVHVFVDNFEKGGFFIEEYIPGATAGDVLSTMQYSQDRLSGMIKNQMEKMVKNGEIRYKQGTEILNTYRTALSKMTYLKLS
jgi:arginine decarboxylase